MKDNRRSFRFPFAVFRGSVRMTAFAVGSGYTMIVLSMSLVVPTYAATANSVPGAAISTGSSVSQFTSSM